MTTPRQRAKFFQSAMTAFFLLFITQFLYSTGNIFLDAHHPADITFHYIGCVYLAGGFVLYSISHKIFGTLLARRICYLLMCLILIAALILPFPEPFQYVGFIGLGYVCAVSYYTAAITLAGVPHPALIVAISCALAFPLQMLLYLIDLPLTTCMFLILTVLVHAMLILGSMPSVSMGDRQSKLNVTTGFWKDILPALLFMILFFFCLVMEASLSEVSYTAVLNDYPRIFYAMPRIVITIAYLCVALIGDYQQGKYLHLAAFGNMILSILAVYNFINVQFYRLILFNFCAGFYTMYFILAPFLQVTRFSTPFDKFLCSFGRIFCNCIEALLSLFLITRISANSDLLQILSIIAIVAALAFLFVFMQFSYRQQYALLNDPLPENATFDPYDPAAIRQFAERYHFTAREQDVFTLILHHDLPMKTVASELSISERMLYRHMRSLYDKTETESKAGLIALYYQTGAPTRVSSGMS